MTDRTEKIARETLVQAAYKAICGVSKSAGGTTCMRYAVAATDAILASEADQGEAVAVGYVTQALLNDLNNNANAAGYIVAAAAYDNLIPLYAASPVQTPAQVSGKTLADYSDADLRNELHYRAMKFLGDQTKGVECRIVEPTPPQGDSGTKSNKGE
jgi:hypothetical protein